jgi:hypothetical protein
MVHVIVLRATWVVIRTLFVLTHLDYLVSS